MMPAGWGFRPYVEPERQRVVREVSLYRRMVTTLVADRALLDVPLPVLCADVQAVFGVRGDVARHAVCAARALSAC